MKKRIITQELIGCTATVLASPNKNLVGLAGTIVDETKNTFTLETKEGTKMVQKSKNTFALIINNQTVEVDGSSLIRKTEEIR